MKNSFEDLVNKSVDAAFESLDFQKKSDKEKFIKEKLKRKIEGILQEQEEDHCEATIEIEARDKDTVEKIFDFVEYIEHLCNVGASRSFVIDDPVDEEEKEKKWSFDGDGSEKIFDVDIEYDQE